MTASNGRTVLSMPPKFSKALLAAGLAAALVGCGGGSSTTTMAGGEPTDPTAAESAAQQTLQVSYDTAKRRVDALSPSSGASQKKAAQDAVDVLGSLINTTVDLSDADKEKFSDYVETLSKNIDTKTAPVMTDGTDDDRSSTATATARSWLRGVSTHTLGNVPSWPPATKLAGPTTNPSIRDGWTVTSYDYENGTTTHEKGKTFSMEVDKVTPEIEMTWTRLAALSPLDDRGKLIDTTLGGKDIDVELLSNNSAVIMQEVANPVITSTEAQEQTNNPFNDENGKFVRKTQFQQEDFKPMNAKSLIDGGIALDEGENIGNLNPDNTWYDLTKPATFLIASADTESTPRYVMWNSIPAKLTVEVANVSTVTSVRLRFRNDVLEFVPVGEIGTGNPITFRITPVLADNLSLPNTALDPLILQEGKTTTATTEFAYWASQNQSSSVVTVSTFARGGTGDMAFEDVTDIPQMLTGSAEYNGLAAGYYAMGTESNGEFTADAMLTANFGANTDSEMITVSGMIDNFMPITGDDNLSSWNLTLSPVMLNDDNLGNAFSGRTSGGDALGNWNGQFLGMANPGINLEDAADRADDYPEAVVGNFTGHFADNGHVAGAFGADLEE